MKIVIGQYYPASSVLHRLDPRVKLVGTMAFVMALFFVNHWWGYAAAAVALAGVIALSKVPPLYLFRGLKAMLFILTFTALLNVFFTPGQHVLLQWGGVAITREGLNQAAQIVVRLVILVAGSTMMTLTTTPIQLTDAIESLLKPFKLLRFPVHELAMMMTIALRFIPTLVEEVEKIMKAQMARGADFDTGGLIKKARSMVPLLVPLFVSAFRRADELAQAMDARCYRGDINRTKMKVMRLRTRDYVAAGIMAAYLLGLLGLRAVL